MKNLFVKNSLSDEFLKFTFVMIINKNIIVDTKCFHLRQLQPLNFINFLHNIIYVSLNRII